jgi:hypothetical protein
MPKKFYRAALPALLAVVFSFQQLAAADALAAENIDPPVPVL